MPRPSDGHSHVSASVCYVLAATADTIFSINYRQRARKVAIARLSCHGMFERKCRFTFIQLEITQTICERERRRLLVRFFLLDKTLLFGFLLRVFIEQNVLLGFEVAMTAVVYDIWYTPSKTRLSLRDVVQTLLLPSRE